LVALTKKQVGVGIE
jgi:hypothetical protein